MYACILPQSLKLREREKEREREREKERERERERETRVDQVAWWDQLLRGWWYITVDKSRLVITVLNYY